MREMIEVNYPKVYELIEQRIAEGSFDTKAPVRKEIFKIMREIIPAVRGHDNITTTLSAVESILRKEDK
jgi:hypothetical protein